MKNEPIIVIDDDPDDHFIFQEVCSKIKYGNELKFFNTALAALEYFQTTNDDPFIVFCDLNMPLMTGMELRRRIESDEKLKLKSIPFIFFTTSASRSQIDEAYKLTVQGFFIKESSFDETERVLTLILEYWTKCKHPKVYSPS
jgi:CheY-like chemotaxis protein